LAIVLFFPINYEKGLLSPIRELISGLRKFHSGDYTVSLSSEYQDELGVIANNFNQIISLLQDFDKSKDFRLGNLSNILEQNPSGVMIIDTEFLVEYVNPMFEHITGYRSDFVLGKSPEMLLSKEIRPMVFKRMLDVIKNGEVWRGELQSVRQNGEEYWVFAVAAPIKNSLGQINHYIWLIEDFTERKRAEKVLLELSTTDQLTGIYNRRQLFTLSKQVVEQARRYRQPLSVLLIDFDNYKEINDSVGHQAGDRLLREFSKTIKQHIRAADIFGRYGGDEFIIILPHTDLAGAEVAAENLRRLVTDLEIRMDNNTFKATISIGISELSKKINSFDKLIEAADKALYTAKQAGRNQVVAYIQQNNSREDN
jgi:diguanylate cyclase (GGDEF)-like protein/PAS domain S-box-containing protein